MKEDTRKEGHEKPIFKSPEFTESQCAVIYTMAGNVALKSVPAEARKVIVDILDVIEKSPGGK